MAKWTTYTSTVSVPIYASWKCQKCGEINFSDGIIACQREITTNAQRKSKLEEAKSAVEESANSEWINNALNIMFEPQEHPQELRTSLHMHNTNCTKCNSKPKWHKGSFYLVLFSISLIVMVISGIIAFVARTNIALWTVFAASVGTFIYTLLTETIFKKAIKKIPKEYLPIFGSLNEDLIAEANKQGKKIFTPEETMEKATNDTL